MRRRDKRKTAPSLENLETRNLQSALGVGVTPPVVGPPVGPPVPPAFVITSSQTVGGGGHKK